MFGINTFFSNQYVRIGGVVHKDEPSLLDINIQVHWQSAPYQNKIS